MTIYVFETPESRQRRGSADANTNTAKLDYGCYGTTDDQEAGDAILAEAPATFRGLEQKDLDLNSLGGDIWHGSLTYVNPDDDQEREPPDLGEWKISFSAGDQTQLMKFAKAGKTTSYPESAADLNGAIGIDNSDGNITVNGVETPVAGGTELTIHYRLAKATIDEDYVDTLDSLRGRRNDATFYGFAAGRLLFLGADGENGSRGDPVVDFRFLLDIDLTGLQYGDIAGVAKPAHALLDIVWEHDYDSGDGVTRPKPVAVYVHEVHDDADFEDLGIGTGV